MGFEQLAALKDQLAKQAEESRLAKQVKAASAPATNQSTPVDPVVLSIARLQKRFPKAFPRNPAPKSAIEGGYV